MTAKGLMQRNCMEFFSCITAASRCWGLDGVPSSMMLHIVYSFSAPNPAVGYKAGMVRKIGKMDYGDNGVPSHAPNG